ncbi:hypothetical protein [Puia dinghuensis]|uniref:Uncharacterized protein n=1 Tax=Puia dinghuensis TaxID=1792502 RepID=A0A8J2XQL9_9BACT|nr:hypothetical protein [Puia dinghuensis]GGA83378.1 hypothetical protein GCM10011511_03050 [Puia dinghuensis]
MKSLVLSALISASCIIALFSCSKKDNTPTPPPPPADSTIHVNYIYLATAVQMQLDSVKQVEVILNEDNGKVLLDTIAAVNTNIIADLKTKAKSFDLTVVRYRPISKAFYLITEKAISPADWTLLPGSDSLVNLPPNVIPAFTPSSVNYTNVPVAQGEPYMFSTYTANTNSGHYSNPGNGSLWIPFQKQSDDDVYLVFPGRALYNFHHMTSTSDVVDLTTMDAAVRIRLPRPAEYPNLDAFLNGFVDSSNLTKNMHLSHYISGIDTIAGADLVYPAKRIFQKYSNNFSVRDATNTFWSNYTNPWSDTVDVNPIFIDDSYYVLSAAANNNFSVSFPKTRPGYYSVDWNSPKFYWALNAPADSTPLHPLDLLTSLKSKMLAGQDLTTMKIIQFSFYYQVDQHKQLVPVKLAPLNGKFVPLPDETPSVSFDRIWP